MVGDPEPQDVVKNTVSKRFNTRCPSYYLRKGRSLSCARPEPIIVTSTTLPNTDGHMAVQLRARTATAPLGLLGGTARAGQGRSAPLSSQAPGPRPAGASRRGLQEGPAAWQEEGCGPHPSLRLLESTVLNNPRNKRTCVHAVQSLFTNCHLIPKQ